MRVVVVKGQEELGLLLSPIQTLSCKALAGATFSDPEITKYPC